MALIHVKFRLVYQLSDRKRVMLFKCRAVQVPEVNEIVSLDGNPYRVISRAWAFGDGDQFAYVDVQKASDFTVTLGGREY